MYRDFENRNWVITQDGREDYLIVPVDVSHPNNEGFAKYSDMALKEFETASNHKAGSNILIRALTACKPRCQHTDDFAGFIDHCSNPQCPTYIWKDNVIYVSA